MDQEEQQQIESLKKIHLKRLRILESQAATFGISAPPHILIEIDELKDKIKTIDYNLQNFSAENDTDTDSEILGLDLTDLRHKLANHFGIEELRTLCFDLKIDSENFSSKKEAFIRELIVYCNRRGSLVKLIDYCRKVRPHISW